MIILAEILTILTLIFWLIGVFTNRISFTFIALAIGILAYIILIIEDPKNTKKEVNIDLPEEYQEISKCSCKPDTLLGYYKDGTLFIEFKPKTK